MTPTALSSVRRSFPDPLDVDSWPEHTSATVTDVVVSGVSMRRLVELCGTPCVHTAAASVPGSGGRPSSSDDAAVVLVRVTAVRGRGAERVVEVDGRLDGCEACWRELRLIGRESAARPAAVGLLTAAEPGAGIQVTLPADVAVGDLIAVPCRRVSALREIRKG